MILEDGDGLFDSLGELVWVFCKVDEFLLVERLQKHSSDLSSIAEVSFWVVLEEGVDLLIEMVSYHSFSLVFRKISTQKWRQWN